MKILLKLLLFFLCLNYLMAEIELFKNLDYYRVYTNYNGSAYNGTSILVYGDAGIIVRSIDGGYNWSQINLDDSLRVLSMTNIGKIYYGVFDKRYIIKSDDDGENWQYFNFGDISLFKILPYNEKLFCMSTTKIIVLNQNLVIEKEYPIIVDTNRYDFTIFKNRIYYGSGNGLLIEIDIITDKTKIIDLEKLGLCTNCTIPENIIYDNFRVYFRIDKDLFSYDEDKVKFAFKPIKKGIFQGNGNELFELYNHTFSTENIDSLYFIKINPNSSTYNRINSDTNDRYITNLSFKHLNFLSFDSIVAVGNDKLIYMSYDRGKHWYLKSHYQGKTRIHTMDRNHHFFIDKYVKFIKSTDGGITWLPQKNYLKYFTSEIRFRDIANFGNSFFYNNDFGYAYYYTLFQGDTNFIYTKDGGETVKLKNSNNVIGYNWGNNYRSAISIRYNDELFFIRCSSSKARKFSMIYNLDDYLEVKRSTFIDSAHVVFIDSMNNELIALTINYQYPIETSQNNWSYDSNYISLITFSDNASTWTKIQDYNVFDNYDGIDFISRVGNNLFLYLKKFGSTPYEICKIDLHTNELEKIFTLPEGFQPTVQGVQKINNKYYFAGAYFINGIIKYELFENDNFENDPTNWKTINLDKRYNGFVITEKNDSLFIISSYDSLMNSDVVWFAKLKTGKSIENKIEILNDIYLASPFPNPARESIYFKISFNQIYDIEKAEIKFFNILGNKISDLNRVSSKSASAVGG